MSEQMNTEEEYQIQYYGFSGRELLQDFTEVVLSEMDKYFSHYTDLISKNTTDIPKLATFAKVQTQWIDQSEKVFRTVEPLIHNFFNIPKNVLLPSDSNFTKTYTQAEVDELQKEVEQLQNECLKENTFIHFCEQELREIKQLESIHIKLKEDFKKVEHMKKQYDSLRKLENIAKTHQKYAKTAFNTECMDDEDAWLAKKINNQIHH